MNLKEVVLGLAELVSGVLIEEGRVLPMAYFLEQDGRIAAGILLDFSSEEAKSASVALAKSIARATGCPVVYVVETFVSRRPKPGILLSEDPDREEAIVVIAFSPHLSATAFLPFSRDDQGNPVLSRPELFDGAVSSWMDPWPDRNSLH